MKKKSLLLLVLAFLLLIIPVTPIQASLIDKGFVTTLEMYRLYNPNSGEHFYTGSTTERDNLIQCGWNYEGVAWYSPSKSSTPVYRFYNPNAGDHFYTTDKTEGTKLIYGGWNYEGISWYSDDYKIQPVYRDYNPNAVTGSHNYTTSSDEANHLTSLGWQNENIAWYGTTASNEQPIVVDSGWFSYKGQDGSTYVSVGALINNPSLKTMTNTLVLITAYDANGNVLASSDNLGGSTELNQILSNTTSGFGLCMYVGRTPAKVEISASCANYDYLDYTNMSSSNFSFSDVNVGANNITGNVTNNGNGSPTSPTLRAIFYNNGKIIGGSCSIMDDYDSSNTYVGFPPGTTKSFSFDIGANQMPSYTDVKLYLNDYY